MPAEVLALLAACGWALASITVKFATQAGGMVAGLVTTLASSIVTLAALAALTVESWTMPATALGLFAVAGLAGPGAGRILLMRGVRDAGTSVAVPVYASVYPLIGSAGGVVLFSEHVGFGRALALGLILGGIWACVRGGSANREMTPGWSHTAPASRPRAWAFAVPGAAGAAFATMDVLTKLALERGGDPVLGALVGMVTAFAMWLAVLTYARPSAPRLFRLTPSFGWYCVNGLLAAGAQVFLLLALGRGDLSAVTPIVASQPVIVLLIGAVALRRLERLRPGTVLGGVGVAIGVAYLSAS